MKSTVTALAFAAALLSVGCGEGHLILNVDVYSFMAGTGKDTVPYLIPPNTTDSASTVQRINMPPGLGSSVIESATLTGTANLINTSGSGTVGFRLFVAADSASTHQAPALALDVPATAVTPGTTSALTLSGGLTPAVLQTFTGTDVWIRIVARGTNSSLVTPVIGEMAITALQLRVVVQDKIL